MNRKQFLWASLLAGCRLGGQVSWADSSPGGLPDYEKGSPGKAVFTGMMRGKFAAAKPSAMGKVFQGPLFIHGEGGAPMPMIRDNLYQDQPTPSPAAIWIIQGGINSIKWYAGYSYDWLMLKHQEQLQQIVDYAQAMGARLFLQEPTPVIASRIELAPYWAGLDVAYKIAGMCDVVDAVARDNPGVGVIRLYRDFLPSWAAWSDANSVHPTAAGVPHLAEAWARGIKPDTSDPSSKYLSIYVGGDSIAQCVSVKIFSDWIEKIWFPAASHGWALYR